MRNYHPENERIKHQYFAFEKEANGKCDKTIDNIVKALTRFEEFTGYACFKTFDDKLATNFKHHLLKAKNKHGQPLSASTIAHTLSPIKEFFKWLAMQAGYKKSIRFHDIEYLNLSDKDRRKMQSKPIKQYPTPEQIKHVLASLPTETDIQKRDRALIAFLFTTGIRDGALIGLKLKHINTEKQYVVQDPKEIETKFSKCINTKFFPVGDEVHVIVKDWVNFLRQEKLFGDNDPLFPKEQLGHDADMSFVGGTLSREHWQSATAIRRILKEAFNLAAIPYFKPHSFRDTLSSMGRTLCTTTEEQMAWAWNLGHESPTTTFISYGGFTTAMQFNAMEKIAARADSGGENPLNMLAQALKQLKDSGQLTV